MSELKILAFATLACCQILKLSMQKSRKFDDGPVGDLRIHRLCFYVCFVVVVAFVLQDL